MVRREHIGNVLPVPVPVEVEVALTFVGALNNAFLEQRDAGAVASRLKYSLRPASKKEPLESREHFFNLLEKGDI